MDQRGYSYPQQSSAPSVINISSQPQQSFPVPAYNGNYNQNNAMYPHHTAASYIQQPPLIAQGPHPPTTMYGYGQAMQGSSHLQGMASNWSARANYPVTHPGYNLSPQNTLPLNPRLKQPLPNVEQPVEHHTASITAPTSVLKPQPGIIPQNDDNADVEAVELYEGQPVFKKDFTPEPEPDLVKEEEDEDHSSSSEEWSNSDVPQKERGATKKWKNTNLDDDGDEDDPSKDPLFDPDDDDYVETPENSDGSGDEFLMTSHRKRKPVKIGRKKGRGGKRVTRSQSQSSREPRRTRSQTSYHIDSSDDDDDETFTIHGGQPSFEKPSSRNSSRSNVNLSSRPKRITATRRSYEMPGSTDESFSSNDDEMTLIQGQPMVKSKNTSRSSHGYMDANAAIESSDTTSVFLARRENLNRIKGLPSPTRLPGLNEGLCIWRLRQNLLQKFTQINDSEMFESTSNYLGYFEESRVLYVQINATVIRSEQNKDIVQIHDHAVMRGQASSISSGMHSGTPSQHAKTQNRSVKEKKAMSTQKRRGRPPKNANTPKPAKRSKSETGESATPRKRGRPRLKKNEDTDTTVLTHTDQPALDPQSGDDENALKRSFTAYAKMLLDAAADDKHVDTDISLIDKQLSEVTARLVASANYDQTYLDDLKLRPIMIEDQGGSDHFCEATNDNKHVTADRIVTLKGQEYDRATLKEIDHHGMVKNYFVSRNIFERSKTFHAAYHFKYHLIQKCFQRIQMKGRITPTEDAGDNLPSINESDVVNTCENKQEEDIKSTVAGQAESDTKVIPEISVQNNSTTKDEVEAIMSDMLTKVEQSDVRKVEECIDDGEWIGQLYTDFTSLLAWSDLKKSEE